MNASHAIYSAVIALGVILVGLIATPLVFAGRIMPSISLANTTLTGISTKDLPAVIAVFDKNLAETLVTIRLRDQEKKFTLEQLGIHINREQTLAAIKAQNKTMIWPLTQEIEPIMTLDDSTARTTLHTAFADQLKLPQNATLTLLPSGQLSVTASKSGEQVDTIALAEDLRHVIADGTPEVITPTIVSAAAPVQDNEVTRAKGLAEQLLRQGIKLHFQDKEFEVKPFTVRRLLTFVEQADPQEPQNAILGVQFKPVELADYLKTTIAPDINRNAVNARFEMKDEKVEQFATPENGETVNLDVSVTNINAALTQAQTDADLAVDTTPPDIKDAHDIETLGITTLLASGQTDYRGSPKNRIHNIEVGTSKYHGILIPPGTEFSFLQYLGPVDGDHGFKPELVIKNNVTTPEFGGGLCQVSTTAFRAAVESGLKITQRRNHSYAVRYYGTPGFDATIYPPYTDLRFLNNTPAYILIQTKIEGTKLTFEFWGTDDGRQVAIDGPHPYNRQLDGAVKSTLKQTVTTADGQSLIEDTFYSNYKSPNLFPHVVAANGENNPAVAGTTTTNVLPPTNPTPTATPNPRP